MTERLHFHFSLSCIGEGNGNPLQCSCLENPRDGEPGGLPSMGSHRVGHDWSKLAAAAQRIFRKISKEYQQFRKWNGNWRENIFVSFYSFLQSLESNVGQVLIRFVMLRHRAQQWQLWASASWIPLLAVSLRYGANGKSLFLPETQFPYL